MQTDGSNRVTSDGARAFTGTWEFRAATRERL
jgi:hypothetical protein